MSDRLPISRRVLIGGGLLLASSRGRALAQGFAGLGMDGTGFASVSPGRIFSFPADLGPHPDYRIEWWYVTGNLRDSGHASDEIAHDVRATRSHYQIVRHMGNDSAPRMFRNDIEMVS